MKILITGHKGYIGSYLHKALGGKGMDIKDGEVGDIREGITWPGFTPDIVINCAVELINKGRMIQDNVVGVESILLDCMTTKAKLIHFSSVSIYGSSYYGLTKKMGEDLIKWWKPKDYVILRMTNVYSPQGKGDSPANRFSRGEVEIFGDGMHTKDHIHIRDVLQAVEKAIQNNWTGTVDLASGSNLTMNNIFTRLGKGTPVYLPDHKVDMKESKLDNHRALSLGWKPTWDLKNVWREGDG